MSKVSTSRVYPPGKRFPHRSYSFPPLTVHERLFGFDSQLMRHELYAPLPRDQARKVCLCRKFRDLCEHQWHEGRPVIDPVHFRVLRG